MSYIKYRWWFLVWDNKTQQHIYQQFQEISTISTMANGISSYYIPYCVVRMGFHHETYGRIMGIYKLYIELIYVDSYHNGQVLHKAGW